MELDNLRRQWQQQPSGPTPAPETTEQTLRAMLAQRTTGPIAQLKRNVQRDIRLGIIVLMLNLFNIINVVNRNGLSAGSRLLVLGLVAVMLMLLALSMWRRRQLVHQLEDSSANLYSQMKTTSRKLRQLLRMSGVMGIVVLLAVATIALYTLHPRLWAYLNPATEHWGQHVTVAVVTVICVALLLTALLAAGRAKQQRRYGQYLDQLDAALRELGSEKTRD